MKKLEEMGFRRIIIGNSVPSITITKKYIRFNVATVRGAGSPPRVELLINDKTNQLLVRGTGVNAPFSLKAGVNNDVVFTNKELLKRAIGSNDKRASCRR